MSVAFNCFTREAEIMDVSMTWIMISSEYLHYIGTFTKMSRLNMKLLVSMSL